MIRAHSTKRKQKRRALDTKGQVETPIVMIFAVGAGVMVLLLIGYFLITQQSAASSQADLEALRDVRDSLASLEGSVGVTQDLSLADGPYTMRCDDLNSGELFLVHETGDEISLRGLLVAAPRDIPSGIVTVTTAPAGTTYRIGTMVYALPQGSVINADSALGVMPVRTGPTVAPPGQIVHSFADGTSAKITVIPDITNADTGTLEFEVNPGGQTIRYPYLDRSLLAAAAVTGDASNYACALDRYTQLLAFNTVLQHRRVQELRTAALNADSSCASIYDETPFDTIENILGATSASTLPGQLIRGRDLTISDAAVIAQALIDIEKMNGRLLRGDRCATVS